jgi:hypothetical protein
MKNSMLEGIAALICIAGGVVASFRQFTPGVYSGYIAGLAFMLSAIMAKRSEEFWEKAKKYYEDEKVKRQQTP